MISRKARNVSKYLVHSFIGVTADLLNLENSAFKNASFYMHQFFASSLSDADMFKKLPRSTAEFLSYCRQSSSSNDATIVGQRWEFYFLVDFEVNSYYFEVISGTSKIKKNANQTNFFYADCIQSWTNKSFNGTLTIRLGSTAEPDSTLHLLYQPFAKSLHMPCCLQVVLPPVSSHHPLSHPL